MKSKYLMVALLTLGLSSVAGAVGCRDDDECQKINCSHRVTGVNLILKQNGNPYEIKGVTADDHATCKRVGGEAYGKAGHCVCNVNIDI